VSRTNARVRPWVRTRAFCVSLLLGAALAPVARAVELALPASAIARIGAACPDCPPDGWTACGSQDVAWGKGFAKHAFLGTPKRGYLLGFSLTGAEFRKFVETSAYPILQRGLERRFYRTRLVVLDDAFADARVLAAPSEIDVAVPEPLHACLYGTWRPWGCCVANCAKEECCEKKLGSPTVELTWRDGDETLVLHYSHTVGVSWLERRTGGTSVRYACLVDAKGKLRASDAK
jgi:hypothetical protein